MIENHRTNSGFLWCDECRLMWCEHIEEFVRVMDDAPLIWAAHPFPQDIQVPIVPTQNIWSKVVLQAPSDGKKNYHVEIYFDRPSSTTPALLFMEQEFLGFMHPGEGRMTLREMILDWFIGTKEATVESQGCTAAGHGYKQEIRWRDDMNHPERILVQHWSVWATGQCLGCTYDPSNNASFIPSVDPTPSPFTR